MLNKIDPIHLWLEKVVLRQFYKTNLSAEERSFIQDNTQKNRRALWLNVAAAVLIYIGLNQVDGDALRSIITALLAPVMVMGAAWFAISFGGIPAKLINAAMSITFWMFTAFSVSFTAMCVAICMISPWPIWIVVVVIYYGTISACLQYDTADGLKAGLDDTVLKHSRAALRFYRNQGISIDEQDES